MNEKLEIFRDEYLAHLKQRETQGIPPLPLSAGQVEAVCQALLEETLDQGFFSLPGYQNTVDSLLYLLDHRVPPGVYPASQVKASFLGEILGEQKRSVYIDRMMTLDMLGRMVGGANMEYIINALDYEGTLAERAVEILSKLFLISPDELERISKMADSNSYARKVLANLGAASWFSSCPPLEMQRQMMVVRTTGEINTDFFSPAQEASTRDDIPLHALKILSTSPHDQNFLQRLAKLKEIGKKIMLAGDVVGTGSSRKSASNSLVWWIGDNIPNVPNKRRGGLVMAAKIAPIFFNTLRGCGSIPIRCSTGKIEEGTIVNVDLQAGVVKDENGVVLSEFKVEPASILEEARAGGRNNLIIGRKLTREVRKICAQKGIGVKDVALELPEFCHYEADASFSLAQKIIGQACGCKGVKPGDYLEPKAELVYSQDTTGAMTMQEIQELACKKFNTVMIQSFCHTAAGPKSKDSSMQNRLGGFMNHLGGIDLRPGDGVIHINGNRFLLPYFVGTGGDSHTRFPIGISFPAGSDLVAFAASQGYFPLDMPESVLARFKGKMEPGITVRDLVNAIPYVGLKTGLVNLEKGDKKANAFADRILEIQGLEFLNVVEAYKLTDASAERSAAGSTFSHKLDNVIQYVENNLKFLKTNFSQRHPSPTVKVVIEKMEEWLKNPSLPEADQKADYAEVVDIDLKQIKEPLLAAPNDPDKIVTLSEVAGTRIDEVFIGSCMVDITDFRVAAALLEGEKIPHQMKFWTVPPDRESNVQLGREGILGRLMEAGANIHVPGCSLCMGNQAQVADNANTFSTSTRNFDNRMGTGAQVFLGSAHLATVIAIKGQIPTLDEYLALYQEKVAPRLEEINRPLEF